MNINALLDLLMVASPVLVGAALSGWSAWSIVSGALGMLLFILKRPRIGLAVGILIQSAPAYKYGIVACLFWAGLWMVWSQSRFQHVAAALVLAACGALTPVALIREIAWSSSGAVAAVTAANYVWTARKSIDFES
jgi:hypothetical protein